MVICGRAELTSRGGRNVSCDPAARYRTRYTLSRASLSLSRSLLPPPRPCAPLGVMSTTRHATHRSEASRLSSEEEGVSIKEITKRIFASAAERIAVTRTPSRVRLSLTKRDTAELLVNNVVFNIVLYGIALYDLYTASAADKFRAHRKPATNTESVHTTPLIATNCRDIQETS